MTKSENLRLQRGAGPKNGDDQSTKGDEKRVHRETIMISRGIANLAFSARTEFSVATGHPVSVLAVSYPGRRIRHISLRSEQVPEVQRQLENYQRLKASLEQICELNQQVLRPKLADSKSGR